MLERDRLSDCVRYFQKNDFKRLFSAIRNKYISLERMGGAVVLIDLKISEKEALEGFLKKDFRKQKTATIRLEHVQKAIDDSRFEGLNLYDIAEAYFGESFETKRAEKERMMVEKAAFFNEIKEQFHDSFATEWLESVLSEQRSKMRYFTQKYNENPIAFRECLVQVMFAANALPIWSKEKERLPVFAANIANDPHFFDDGRDAHILLLMVCSFYVMRYLHEMDRYGENVSMYKAEEKNRLLYEVGLLKDDISNYTIAYGIHAFYKDKRRHKCGFQSW